MVHVNVPLDWSACYAVDGCAEHCTWMPCSDMDQYMGAVQALRHQMQCQHCTDASACWGTGTAESVHWARARFAQVPAGNATAEKCSTEMSTLLMVILLGMIAALAASVCYFARRQSVLRRVRGVQLSDDCADEEPPADAPESA